MDEEHDRSPVRHPVRRSQHTTSQQIQPLVLQYGRRSASLPRTSHEGTWSWSRSVFCVHHDEGCDTCAAFLSHSASNATSASYIEAGRQRDNALNSEVHSLRSRLAAAEHDASAALRRERARVVKLEDQLNGLRGELQKTRARCAELEAAAAASLVLPAQQTSPIAVRGDQATALADVPDVAMVEPEEGEILEDEEMVDGDGVRPLDPTTSIEVEHTRSIRPPLPPPLSIPKSPPAECTRPSVEAAPPRFSRPASRLSVPGTERVRPSDPYAIDADDDYAAPQPQGSPPSPLTDDDEHTKRQWLAHVASKQRKAERIAKAEAEKGPGRSAEQRELHRKKRIAWQTLQIYNDAVRRGERSADIHPPPSHHGYRLCNLIAWAEEDGRYMEEASQRPAEANQAPADAQSLYAVDPTARCPPDATDRPRHYEPLAPSRDVRRDYHATEPGPSRPPGDRPSSHRQRDSSAVRRAPRPKSIDPNRWWQRFLFAPTPRFVPGGGGERPDHETTMNANPPDTVGWARDSVPMPNPRWFPKAPPERVRDGSGFVVPVNWYDVITYAANALLPQETDLRTAWLEFRRVAARVVDRSLETPEMPLDTAEWIMAVRWDPHSWLAEVQRRETYRKLVMDARARMVDNTETEEDCKILEEEDAKAGGQVRSWDEIMEYGTLPLVPSCSDPPPFRVSYFEEWMLFLKENTHLYIDGIRRGPGGEVIRPDALRGALYIGQLGPPPHMGLRAMHWLAVVALVHQQHGVLRNTSFFDVSRCFPWAKQVTVQNVRHWLENLVEKRSMHLDVCNISMEESRAREPILTWLRELGPAYEQKRPPYPED